MDRSFFDSALHSTSIIIIITLWSIGLHFGYSGADKLDHRLLLISFDGFRWDFLNRPGNFPNFDRVKRQGVQATHGLKSEFVTNTYPNHYSMASGLHVESHGFVDNMMHDPRTGRDYMPEFYDPTVTLHPDWFQNIGTPIWVLNQRHQGKSGVYMWMGGETEIDGDRPTRFVHYKDHVPELERVNTMLAWLADSDDPVNLGLLYFDQPDFRSHEVGPESEILVKKLEELDSVIGHLLDELEEFGLLATTDIIITADHGFIAVSRDKLIRLEDIADPAWYLQSSYMPGALALVFPKKGKEEIVYQSFKSASERDGHFTVYRRDDIPERFHYKRHPRVGDIVAIADAGYTFTMSLSDPQTYENMGNHGYDNALPDMHPFFMALGPSFKENYAVDTFDLVDIYPLMCRILGLAPAPNNGSMEVVQHLLKDGPTENGLDPVWVVVGAVLLGLTVLLLIKFRSRQAVKKKPL